MLDAIGVETLDDLFADVHPRYEGELDLPPALSEYEALREVDRSFSVRGPTIGSYPPPLARSSRAVSS
jgi:glycine cleavage system pyridoxal-binding protein P